MSIPVCTVAIALLSAHAHNTPTALVLEDLHWADAASLEILGALFAASPELRDAIAEQSAGLAQEMVAGVRTRTQSMDDLAERTVRGWLRRPRPRPA